MYVLIFIVWLWLYIDMMKFNFRQHIFININLIGSVTNVLKGARRRAQDINYLQRVGSTQVYVMQTGLQKPMCGTIVLSLILPDIKTFLVWLKHVEANTAFKDCLAAAEEYYHSFRVVSVAIWHMQIQYSLSCVLQQFPRNLCIC